MIDTQLSKELVVQTTQELEEKIQLLDTDIAFFERMGELAERERSYLRNELHEYFKILTEMKEEEL